MDKKEIVELIFNEFDPILADAMMGAHLRQEEVRVVAEKAAKKIIDLLAAETASK